MVKVIEDNTSKPVCPNCEKELDSVHSQRMETTFGVRFIYFCSYCKKVLGITHRKGFWMG